MGPRHSARSALQPGIRPELLVQLALHDLLVARDRAPALAALGLGLFGSAGVGHAVLGAAGGRAPIVLRIVETFAVGVGGGVRGCAGRHGELLVSNGQGSTDELLRTFPACNRKGRCRALSWTPMTPALPQARSVRTRRRRRGSRRLHVWRAS